MTIQVVVDTAAAVPVYEQIRSQLAGAIADGRLADGQRLPSVRALAADLGIAVNTVGRAYTELESAGLIASRRRTGSVVTAGARDPIPAEVLAAATRLARSAAAARLTAEQTVDLVRSAMHAAAGADRAVPSPDDVDATDVDAADAAAREVTAGGAPVSSTVGRVPV